MLEVNSRPQMQRIADACAADTKPKEEWEKSGRSRGS
jgi:hypothetical protein